MVARNETGVISSAPPNFARVHSRLEVVAEIPCRVLRNAFVSERLALSGRRRCLFQMLLDLAPAPHRRTEGVGECNVVAPRPCDSIVNRCQTLRRNHPIYPIDVESSDRQQDPRP